MPSAYAPRDSPPEQPPRRRLPKALLPIIFGVLGISLAVGARWLREGQRADQVAAPPPPPAAAPAPTVQSTAGQQPTAAPHATGQPTAALTTTFPLTKEDKVGKGEGMLEIVAGQNDRIHVNGRLIGKGPVVKMALKAVPDPYEVRVKLRSEERVRYVVVQEGKRVRVRVAPPWSR